MDDAGEAREPMLTAREAAKYLHVHVNTIKRLSDRGKIPFYRISSRGDRRYYLKDLVKFVEGSDQGK